MGNIALQPGRELPVVSAARKLPVPIQLWGTMPTDVVPAECYVEQLWAALDLTLQRFGCGVGSDTPVAQGGALHLTTFKIVGAPAPVRESSPEPPDHLHHHHHQSISHRRRMQQ